MAGKFFHTAHPHTLADIRLTLLTQIVIFWEKKHKFRKFLEISGLFHKKYQIFAKFCEIPAKFHAILAEKLHFCEKNGFLRQKIKKIHKTI